MATNNRNSHGCWVYLRKLKPNFDHLFYRLGHAIGSHPLVSLCLSTILLIAAGLGLLSWVEEVDNVELFMPHTSRVRADALWVEEHFEDDVRFESVIVEADNVLDKDVLLAIMDLETQVKAINVSEHGWEDVCAGYLTWFKDDAILEFQEEIDAAIKEGIFRNDCIYQSLMKLWDANSSTIHSFKALTQDKILDNLTQAVNFSTQKNVLDEVKPLLSHLEYDLEGRVKGAKATILNWMLKKTVLASLDWELEFIQQTLFSNRTLPKGMKVYAVSSRSYFDFLHEVLKNNLAVLFAGFTLIIVYVMIMLGQFNAVRQRVYLSLMAVSLVGQAILASYGLCFYMGFFWGPIHPILPFLLLGVGIDNTFVIVQCVDNIKQDDKRVNIPDRIALALEKAGVSITITSLTDILAFAVGTSSAMPFLRSFCVFAATGILFLYIFEILFFLSCLTLDEYRIQNKRDGCCFQERVNWRPSYCSQRSFLKITFSEYIAPALMKTPVKILVILSTITLFAVNIACVLQVEQRFDPIWYLNPESYPIQFNDKLNQYFPQFGKRAGIYLGGVNYFEEEERLNKLFSLLKSNHYINNATVDFWYPAFKVWLSKRITEQYEFPEDEDGMKGYLSEYLLFTKEGQTFVKDIKFTQLPIGEYNITTSKITIQHILMNTTDEQVDAMESIQNILKDVNFTNDEQIVAFSPDYVSWTANKIIGEELIRNLGLTIGAVSIVTLVLIQNIRTALLVISCVIFTVTDLVGIMYWFGLTIEISTSIMVLLCAGLAVDYAAHVGHEFTRLPGTKNERAIGAVSLIGAAVFNGGLSTFLAFFLLGFSQSYLFTTFFKLFSGVVTFGVFHGLIFLPVILSWLGPEEQKIPHCKVSLPLKQDDVLFSPLNMNKDVVHEHTESQPLQENHHGKMDG